MSGSFLARDALLAAALAALWAVTPACVSGGGDDTSSSDAGSSGSGGSGHTGGAAGAAGDAGTEGGSGGTSPEQDAGPVFDLPTGCAPADSHFACNPLTNEGCDAGEACDYGLDDYFTCYPGPNDVDEGGACDLEQGPFCKAGMTCDTPGPDVTSGVCAHHCCASTDCAAPQACDTYDPEFGTLGVCH